MYEFFELFCFSSLFEDLVVTFFADSLNAMCYPFLALALPNIIHSSILVPKY